jgi:hypothetical protein
MFIKHYVPVSFVWSFVCDTSVKLYDMKKIIASIIVLCFTSALFAQHTEVQFGIKGGLNLANFNDADSRNTDAKTGFHIGGLAHIHLSKSFAVQPEIMFSAQGAEYANGMKSKLNYINIPVLAQYMFADGFRLQTGPQLGILTSAENKINNVEVDVDDATKKTDIAWSFGLSYITHMGIGFDGRYNLGLTDISKNDADLKNRVWQLGVFYQFHR